MSLILLAYMLTATANAKDENLIEFNQAYSDFQILTKQGKWKEWLPHAENAYQLGKQVHGETSKHTAALAQNYGLNLYELDRNKEAENWLNISLSISENNLGKDAPELIPILMNLGKAAANHESSRSQEKYFRRMLGIAKDNFGESSTRYASLQGGVGRSLYNTGHLRKAKKYIYDGYEILQRVLGDSSPKTGNAAFHIGKYEMTHRGYEEAIKYLNKALLGFDSGKAMSRNELTTRAFLIDAYENMGESEKATQHCLAIGRMKPAVEVQNYVPIFKKLPIFPRVALRARITGDVIVEFEVDANGFVVEPKMVSYTVSDQPTPKN